MKKTLIVIPLLVLTLLLTACGHKTPDKQDAPDTTTTTTESAVEGGSTTSSNGGDTSTTGDKAKPTDNVVNWEDLFGDEDTTTGKDGKTTTTSTTKKKNTTSTAPTTTLKPTTIDKVSLPAVGSDVDGRGRIKVSGVSLKNAKNATSSRLSN